MTEYQIDKLANGVRVQVGGVDSQQQADLLAAFGECQQGR